MSKIVKAVVNTGAFGIIKSEKSNEAKETDYILEANKPDTAFVLKEINEAGVNSQLILRLQTSQDPAGYKNVILIFQCFV